MFAQSAAFQRTAMPEVEADAVYAPDAARVPCMRSLPPAPAPAAIEPPAPRVEPVPLRVAPPARPVENCDQLMQAARRHADHGMPDAAEHDCRKAIAIAAFDPRPYFLLAQLAQERGDTAQAKKLMKKVIYLDPSFVAAYLELGALQTQAGESERALRMYEAARGVLLTLPAAAAVAPYDASTAADVLAYVERLLGTPAADAATPDQAQAQQNA
jgi:chemotaxis protein methyltransferase CheR